MIDMAKLVLKFDNRVLKELPLGNGPIRIGRAPDNDIHIDNLGVSDYHARVFTESERLILEDLDSLNGTFLNNSRVKREWLRSADAILIGKHVIVVDLLHDAAPVLGTGRRVAAPKVEETVVMSTKGRLELRQGGPDEKGAQSERARVPSLVVLKGNTQQKDYVLSGKLTVIGKSPMATVRLKGWFAPQVAAQINKRQDGYYLGLGKRIPKINGVSTKPPVRLNDGDLIEVAGVVLKFMYRD
jgi:pSer/pThr/pTyr-binding forkhead associated (FHA) protein